MCCTSNLDILVGLKGSSCGIISTPISDGIGFFSVKHAIPVVARYFSFNEQDQNEMIMKAATILWWGLASLMASSILYAYERVKAEEVTAVVLIQDNPNQYCAKMKDGKLVVMHEGKAITGDVFLKNGTTIKPDGTVITKEGVRTVLKEGSCIDADGKINVLKTGEPYQNEE